ncbi:hypothetical protein [Ramlibacter sp.]|nr:hypothetical protein [Ramlibacter sp.]
MYPQRSAARICVGGQLLDVPVAALAWCRISVAVQVLVVVDDALWIKVMA